MFVIRIQSLKTSLAACFPSVICYRCMFVVFKENFRDSYMDFLILIHNVWPQISLGKITQLLLAQLCLLFPGFSKKKLHFLGLLIRLLSLLPQISSQCFSVCKFNHCRG